MSDLDKLLSEKQRAELASALDQVMRIGHGRVSVIVKNGVPRFISYELEKILDP